MRAVTQLKYVAIAGMTSFIMACSSNPKVEESAPPPVKKVEAPIKIIETARGPSLTLEDVQFDFEQSSLRPEAASIIERAAVYLRENPSRYAMVEGHTDTSGDTDYNQYLSNMRSESVRDALLAEGISKSRITTRGMGETQPVADNSTLAGRQANRRVEIIFKVRGTRL